jgi:thymidylate synthase (FAD)
MSEDSSILFFPSESKELRSNLSSYFFIRGVNMKFVDQTFQILTKLDSDYILRRVEACGRICYDSDQTNDIEMTKKFVKKLIERGHESVLEHFSFSVLFVIDRAIANEITRHRIASFSQQSTRYVKFDELEIINHSIVNNNDYYLTILKCESTYKKMLELGYAPEIARDVLPLATATRLVMTANLREWRHFLKLRTARNAHPYLRSLAIGLLNELKNKIPVVFDDIEPFSP